jgi:hypothetical protein
MGEYLLIQHLCATRDLVQPPWHLVVLAITLGGVALSAILIMGRIMRPSYGIEVSLLQRLALSLIGASSWQLM